MDGWTRDGNGEEYDEPAEKNDMTRCNMLPWHDKIIDEARDMCLSHDTHVVVAVAINMHDMLQK